MKLSIIIPVFRVEKTLDRCVASVVGQDYDDMEIILVDDGSPDRCPEMCDQWARRDSRIKVVHQENQGLSCARNTGISLSRGEFITFVDSDDSLGEDTLKTVMPLAEQADIIEYPVWQNYGSPGQSLLTFEDREFDSADDYWLGTQGYCHCYVWNKIYRRRLFDGVEFPAGKVFEDVYILPRLLQKKPRIATTSKGCYCYWKNTQGITATARGAELRMLLDAHLTSGMPVDDRYYMYLLNIQMDVYEQAGDKPILRQRHVSIPKGDIKLMLKAIAINILDINKICKINKMIHKLR